jgi:hypothetical protein
LSSFHPVAEWVDGSPNFPVSFIFPSNERYGYSRVMVFELFFIVRPHFDVSRPKLWHLGWEKLSSSDFELKRG